MTVNDETLSAFLDRELPEHDMQAVRDTLAADATVAARLAELAQVNRYVQQHAAALDAQPLPDAILALLSAEPAQRANNVVSLSLWQRSRVFMMEHTALAASLLLAAGLVGGYLGRSPAEPLTGSAAIYAVLDATPSGQSVAIAADAQVLPNFSFRNKDGQYCRQFQLSTTVSVTANIACRETEGWQLQASAKTDGVQGSAGYQPATGKDPLETELDTMMQGGALDTNDEAALIRRHWLP